MQSPDEFQSVGREGPAEWNPVTADSGNSTLQKNEVQVRARQDPGGPRVAPNPDNPGSVEESERKTFIPPVPRRFVSKVHNPEVMVDPSTRGSGPMSNGRAVECAGRVPVGILQGMSVSIKAGQNLEIPPGCFEKCCAPGCFLDSSLALIAVVLETA